MTNQHPITPSPELVREWCAHSNKHETYDQFWCHIATQAARWGADQELEACAEWLDQNCNHCWELLADLRAARRPKPPSLKEQALEVVTGLEKRWDLQCDLTLLRRAIEALPND